MGPIWTCPYGAIWVLLSGSTCVPYWHTQMNPVGPRWNPDWPRCPNQICPDAAHKYAAHVCPDAAHICPDNPHICPVAPHICPDAPRICQDALSIFSDALQLCVDALHICLDALIQVESNNLVHWKDTVICLVHPCIFGLGY